MEVHRTPLLNIFQAKQRLEIPLFQRQYVWDREDQWLPLWEDIERKFIEVLEEDVNTSPNHFLGTLVLDQKQTPTTHVMVRQVIDGQQRLSTLQIFLSAFRDFCLESDCPELAKELEQSIFNKGHMADKEVDQFKVWPTKLDRSQFKNVVSAGSFDELLSRYPTVRKKWARKPDPKPKMVEAYFFFYKVLKDFFTSDEKIDPDSPIEVRLDKCLLTLKNALQVVVIDLDSEDDPQVIFETLNARGQPLLPADLIRNYVFLRARRENLDSNNLYNLYWHEFDEEFWRKEASQGRLKRPLSDIFIQHFLSCRQARDIPIKHLYVEYKHWKENKESSLGVEEEVKLLSVQGQNYRRLLDPEENDPIAPLANFIRDFEVSTLYPLVLAFFEVEPDENEWSRITATLESYIIRRTFCDLTAKNYNKGFLSILRDLRKSGISAENLNKILKEETGESGIWPDNARFRKGWMQKEVYRSLGNKRLVHILSKLNNSYNSELSEQFSFKNQPTIEHIMPRDWIKNWPFPSGEKGMELWELWKAEEDDVRAIATNHRNSYIHRIGNLTLLSTSLNVVESNLSWEKKQSLMKEHSLLPLNLQLQSFDNWDENTIDTRARELFEHAIKIWEL